MSHVLCSAHKIIQFTFRKEKGILQRFFFFDWQHIAHHHHVNYYLVLMKDYLAPQTLPEKRLDALTCCFGCDKALYKNLALLLF